jgi:formate hydrogenlyase subunit 6/NADH:ubiquinone oxidoreductase subunit I
MDIPCIVCQENCPVSPKAIFTREYFSTVRAGVLKVLRADAHTLELQGEALQAGKFATGDYFIKTTDRQLRRILENTESTIIIDKQNLLDRLPMPGSQIEIQVRLQRPYVDPKLCIGCGICEHECPVRGQRAIRVTAENESRNPERSMLLRNI